MIKKLKQTIEEETRLAKEQVTYPDYNKYIREELEIEIKYAQLWLEKNLYIYVGAAIRANKKGILIDREWIKQFPGKPSFQAVSHAVNTIDGFRGEYYNDGFLYGEEYVKITWNKEQSK